jgi:uncharacterized protein YdiU (UPF0061 family)
MILSTGRALLDPFAVCSSPMNTRLHFINSFANQLPGLEKWTSGSILTPHVLHSKVNAQPVSNPQLLLWSDSAAALLQIRRESESPAELAQIFSGNILAEGMSPIATRYGGHQFGIWAGQLGDGRALLLGEIATSNLETPGHWEIQLKGAGPTPYSRRADGRAVLRSSVREFLCSEAMFYLGVPTSRALCCVTTGDSVLRDMFYDGHPELEVGAITTRLAPSFLRFGHFEILAATNEVELLQKLIDYSIGHDFSHLDISSPDSRALWFEEICQSTARLMVDWTRVGFVHGVMNTDNLSILGLTIDYGPYGFLEEYDPQWTPNTTDHEHRRYRFGAQASVAYWNLCRLAEALLVAGLSESEIEKGLTAYKSTYETNLLSMLAMKLGLDSLSLETDLDFIQKLDSVLVLTKADLTLFYRQLISVSETLAELKPDLPFDIANFFGDIFYEPLTDHGSKELQLWLKEYHTRLLANRLPTAKHVAKMKSQSPYFVLRNYIVQEALEAYAAGDRAPLDKIHLALQTPYEENDSTRVFFRKRPDWARNKPGCSALSCSS